MDRAPTSTLVVFSLVAAVERHLNAYAAIAAADAVHRFPSEDAVPASLLEAMTRDLEAWNETKAAIHKAMDQSRAGA